MRAPRVIMAAAVAIAGSLTLSGTASASATYVLTRPDTGDRAYWNPDSDILSVCDNSPGNGTAYTILDVIGGGGWILYDSNGAQPGCGTAGPLSVNNTKHAYLEIFPSNPCTCSEVWIEVKL